MSCRPLRFYTVYALPISIGKVVVLVLALLFLNDELRAQKFPRKGVPLIHNFTPEQYHHAGKAWEIRSGNNGILYFATDKGLLEFDGDRWLQYEGSTGFTRSLLMVSDTVCYTGSDQDFGRWQKTPAGGFSYTSINPFRESNKGLSEEFWGTHQIDKDRVFVSYDNVYVYREEQLTKTAAPSRFYGSCASGGSVYLFDEKSGLLEFDGLSLKRLFRFPASYSKTPRIVSVQERGAELIIITREQGVFRFANGELSPLQQAVTPYLKRDQVFSFALVDDSHFAFGTILSGVYITDLSGEIIQHIDKQKGLLSNTILSMHYSQQGRLWLGMDVGIATIELGSEVTYFLDQRGQVGTGYAGLVHQGIFYLGTNQGLYTTSWKQLDNNASGPDFRLVPGSAGQVWSLALVDGKVLCGHDRGLFEVVGNDLKQLHDEPGVLTIRALDEDHLLTGNYNGLSLFQKQAGPWVFSRKVPPVQGACNQIIPEGNQFIWLNIPNYGLIRASIGQDYSITDQQIFPVDAFAGEYPQLYREEDVIKVMTGEGVYSYDPVGQAFGPATIPQVFHRVENSLPGAYHPIALYESFGLVPVHGGFALKNSAYSVPPVVSPPLTIRSVQAFNNDSTQAVSQGAEVNRHLTNLRFNYLLPQQDGLKYQHKLDNHTSDWSDWATTREVEYLNLASGEYTFRVRVKSGSKLSAEETFTFSVARPWYKTPVAYVLYGLLALAVLYLNYLWQEYKLKQQREKLKAEARVSEQLQKAAEEQENLQKRYGMLESGLGEVKKQLRSKTIGLARKAKENDKKGRILQSLKERVDNVLKKGGGDKFEWQQLSRILDNYPETEDDSFSIQMEELHKGGLQYLSKKFPDLTTYDLRLCAYLKSGLTTREIAELMNVLPSSVNVSRSRLRKKLRLESKDDLYKYLNSLE